MRPSKTYKTVRRENDSGIPDNLKNCKQCGKVFISVGDETLCRECFKREEADRNRVMDYVRDNPGVTIEQALAATGVPDRMLKRMVREGMFTNNANRAVTTASRRCAICGAPIGGKGIYCSRCASRFKQETKQIVEHKTDRFVEKKIKDMNIIDKLNSQAEREFELENLQRQLQAK